MNNATMLYRCPGPESFEGVSCETTIVDEPDVEAHLADGWHRNWIEAGEAAAEDTAAKLKANEEEQQRIAAQLAAAGQGDGGAADLVGDEPTGGLKAVHKGRGKYDVIDAAGAVVATGLSKDEAAALAGG